MPESPRSTDNANGDQPFDLHYFVPEADLVDRVSSIYFARIHISNFDEFEPALRPQFRIMSKADGEYVFADGHRFPATRATIIGPTSASVRAIVRGPTALYGFGILPAGWASLMGDEAEKLTDRAIDATELFGTWVHEAADALITARSDEERLVIINNIARDVMRSYDASPLWFIRTVDNWLTASASPQVADLVAASGMSIRSVERMTKHYYGLTPRMLARRYRAVRTAAALARGEDLASMNLADAFYDQSHLIREVKRFAGATPRQLANPTRYTEATTKGRKKLAGRVNKTVSDT